MAQALLLLRTSSSDALAGALAAMARTLQFATCLDADVLPALAHSAGMPSGLPEALLTCRPDDAPAILAEVASLIDREASSVLVFTRHDILPGRDVIRLYFGLRRLERLTLDEFQDYWLNRHADFGRRLIPPYTYHQLHADSVATGRLAQVTGLAASDLDGVVEVHFPDVAALVRQLSREEVARDALADERNFIDHARSQFWAYREVL